MCSSDLSVWGDGTARREFTFVDDVADFIISSLDHLIELPPMLNVGAGVDHTVADYHRMASRIVGFEGELEFDDSQPVGMRQRLMDSSLAVAHGWSAPTSLHDGMNSAYQDYLRRLT